MNGLHSSIFHDVFWQAISSLKENRLRTVLSILGITIGICAVMVVGTVSQGVKKYVYQELDTYGLETLWIYRKWEDEDPFRTVREGSGIDNDDLKYLRSCCASVKRVSPVVYIDGDVVMRSKGDFSKINLEGVGIHYIGINNDRVIQGRDLRLEDIQRRKPVAIIGTAIRDEMFGKHTNPLGQILRWGEVRLTVVGMLEEKNRDILGQLGTDDYDVNKRVLIPYTLYQQQLGSKDIQTLQAEAVSVAETKKALKELTELLHRRHNANFEYATESMEGWIETAEDLLRNISFVGLIAALISLLVGGMGIMNIMSTSVVERTREIGVRKALGAYRRDILAQFLLEATVVSVIGGILGMILGIFAGFGISYLSGYALGVSWSSAVMAVLVSIAVGMVSGYYPAHRAASLKPVDALRYE
ncbi:MAG: ABC transporter permease [Gammaproteobacteria bacterium]|nr:ABC transporter permease [Gammaproteobacteria bacterium]